VNWNTSVATLWCRSEYLIRGRQGGLHRSGAKVNSSYYCNIVLERVCCLTSKQYVVITGGHCSRMEHTARTTIDYLNKEQINFIEPHMWPTNSPDINPVDYAILGYSFCNEPTTNDNNSRRWKKWSERQSPSGKNSHSVSLITVSMNGVDVLKLLSRMAADTSSIATWLKQPHIILILSKDMFSL